MIVPMLVSLGINLFVVEKILSRPFVNLGLLIAAGGACAWQLLLHSRRRASASKAVKEAEEQRKEGLLGTVAWYILLVLWAASVIYIVFFR